MVFEVQVKQRDQVLFSLKTQKFGGKLKKLLLLIVILISSIPIFAEYEHRVPGTKTIELETLNDIRDACHPIHGHSGFSPIIRKYWSDYIGTDYDSTRDLEEREDRRKQFETGVYVREAFWGAIGHETDQHVPVQTPEQILDLARRHLLDPSFENPPGTSAYLSLNSVDEYMHNEYEDAFGRCLNLVYIVENTAFMVDMLWEYQDGDFQTDLATKLDSLASYVHELIYALGENGFDSVASVWITEPQPEPWDNPNISFHNGRIRLAGALGYAGCVLLNTSFHDVAEDYIEHAEDELFTFDHSQVSVTNPGFIGLQLTNSGVYSEGPAYTNYAFDGISLFFTALHRQTGVNHYDHVYMQQIFENSLKYIAPDFKAITQDDTYKQSDYTYEVFIHYLYQSDAISNEMKDTMKWYLNKYKEEPVSGYNNYPDNYNRQKYIFDFNPYINITNYSNIIPESISNGSYSDEELTILRREINTVDEYINSPTMIVNHENSLALNHEDSDQSSFQLYYKGKQLLIDPGYAPASQYNIAKEWLESPYAHNLIMVNPDTLREDDALDSDYYDILEDVNVDSIWAGNVSWSSWSDFHPEKWFEPVGDHGSVTNAELLTPCSKNYFIQNNKIQHLQSLLEYDHEQSYYELNGQPLNTDDDILIDRNYYMIDDSYFIIYDEVTSLDHNSQNEFCNQLHFGSIPVDVNGLLDDSLDSLGVSLYRYQYRNYPIYLHLSIGSQSIASSYSTRNNLPSGIYKTKHYVDRQEHRDLRLFTETTGDEQFLTLIIPSESDTTPIEFIENYSNGYGINYDLDSNDSYETYTAVYSGDTFFRFLQDEMQFNTCAEFFLIKTDEYCSNIEKLILTGDNSFEVHDLVGTRFSDVLVFNSDYDSEEVIAEWSENNELEITTLMSFTSPIPLPIPNPKYKILRCGVLPENLFSKTNYYSNGSTNQHERGTIGNNIETLAYDSTYFYVNYEYSDLLNENLLTSDLTIHQGVFDGITIQGVTQFGTGNIVLKTEVPVPTGAEIVFLPGSHPKLDSDFNLIVDGNFTAIGTVENNIRFDKYSSTNWHKIEITNYGNVNIKHCIFTNAQYPLNNKGFAVVDSCIFQNNDRGIIIDRPSGYQIKNSTIENCHDFGILVRNSYTTMYRSSIENNHIKNNNYGLWFFHASAYVNTDTISTNRYAGILANRGSNPIVTNSSISGTYYNSTNYPEIKLSGTSYPVIDRGRNDIIFGDGNSIYNIDTTPREYICRDIWWGTTKSSP